MQKRALYPVIVGILSPGPRHDYHVQTTIEHLLVQSITFPDQSCDPVSDDAVSHLLTDRDPNPVPIKIIAGFQVVCQTVNFFLPLALLAARTFLPPGVLILDLNP